MKNLYTSSAVAVAVLGLSGCTSFPSPTDEFTAAKMDIAGEPLQKIDLINLVDPEIRRQYLPCNVNYMNDESGEKYDNPDDFDQGFEIPRMQRLFYDRDNNKATEFRCALEAANTYALSWPEFQFYFAQYGSTKKGKEEEGFDSEEAKRRWDTLGGEDSKGARGLNELLYKDRQRSLALAARRNQIQDAVLITSESYCRNFKIAMSNRSTSVELMTRIGSTATGVLSTIFVDPATVAGLAGTSTILNGWLGDYNAAYLSEKATRTISKGIDVRREQILYDINARRFFATNDLPETDDPAMRNIYKLSFGIDWEKTRNFASLDFQKQRYADLINVIYQNPAVEDNDSSEPQQARLIEAEPLILDVIFNSRPVTGRLKATKDGKQVDCCFEEVRKLPDSSGDFVIEKDGTYKYELQQEFDYIGPGQTQTISLTYRVKTDGATSNEATIKINVFNPDVAKYMGLTSVDVYSLEMALRDTIIYHDACRIDVGLETASDALDAIDNPTVRTLEKSLEDANNIMQKLEELQKKRESLTSKPNSTD